jgi:hypothetical protein
LKYANLQFSRIDPSYCLYIRTRLGIW